MTEYDVGVTLQVVIEADSKEEAEDIAIKNIRNRLDAYYVEADADVPDTDVGEIANVIEFKRRMKRD